MELQTEFKGSIPPLPCPGYYLVWLEFWARGLLGKGARQGKQTQTYSRAAVEGPER